jgi:hypothetical protein
VEAAEDAARGRETPDPEPIMAALAARRPASHDGAQVSSWMLGVLGVLHAPVYRARELRTRLADEGIDTAMGAYLAQRSAPLGAPGPELVSAAFYGFSPAVVAEHIPAVWKLITPGRVQELTLEAMRELLGRLLAGREAEVAELAGLLGPVAADHPVAGRPLAAAWAGVPTTGEPLLDMWLATCVIRESRGDAHIALLVTEDIGPLESHLITQGDRPELRPMLGSMRGWTASDIEAAALRLRERGLLDAEGSRTDAARRLRSDIERRTDSLTAAPWVAAGEDAVTRIGDLALRLLPPVLTSGTLLPPVLARLGPRS